MADDLLDDLALLIHFDRENASVTLPVVVITDRSVKTLVQVFKSIFQDSVEADQHGKIQATFHQSIDQLLQVDAVLFNPVGRHQQVSVFGNMKIAVAPPCDVIHCRGIFRGPKC